MPYFIDAAPGCRRRYVDVMRQPDDAVFRRQNGVVLCRFHDMLRAFTPRR